MNQRMSQMANKAIFFGWGRNEVYLGRDIKHNSLNSKGLKG